MIRTTLDEAARDELQRLRRTERPPKVRDRIEMIWLSDAGWSAPKIADQLGYHAQTWAGMVRSGDGVASTHLPLSSDITQPNVQGLPVSARIGLVDAWHKLKRGAIDFARRLQRLP
jgi:hypothetical protein